MQLRGGASSTSIFLGSACRTFSSLPRGRRSPILLISTVLRNRDTPARRSLNWTAAGAGSGASGLVVSASNCSVSGLDINGFSADGIVLFAGGETIQANFIGTDSTGTFPIPITLASSSTVPATTRSRHSGSHRECHLRKSGNRSCHSKFVQRDRRRGRELYSIRRWRRPGNLIGIQFVNAGPNNSIGGTTADA